MSTYSEDYKREQTAVETPLALKRRVESLEERLFFLESLLSRAAYRACCVNDLTVEEAIREVLNGINYNTMETEDNE